MSEFCKDCGAQLAPDALFCGSCGMQIQKEEPLDESNYINKDHVQNVSSPLRFFVSSIRAGFDSLRQFLRNPKQLVPMLVLSVLWLILSMLSALDINPQPVRVLSYLTFAQGGMYNGMLGAVGGVIGKAVFAYFVSVLILPIFSGKNPFKGLGGGIKSFFRGLAVNSANALGQLFIGIGLAMIAFNFFTGNASTINNMVGIVGFVLAIRSLWRRAGFFWGFLLSMSNKLSKGRAPTQMAVNRIVSGYAVGSAAGVGLSTFQMPYLPYAIGIVLLIVGIVLGIAGKTRKEAIVT
jgi:hypothetical protein